MIRVVCWGLGAMGSGIAKNIVKKDQMKIVGAIDRDEKLKGKELGNVLGLPKPMSADTRGQYAVVIDDQPEKVLSTRYPDIVVLATNSFISVVLPQILLCIEKHINVITIAEEMAYPFESHPEEAQIIDSMAKKFGVTVLGTGINPGFILDQLILNITGACLEVKKIKAQRINDLSPFGKTVMETQGVGTTLEQFKAGLKNGSIVGHIGFRQSIKMIADYLGWQLDRIEEEREPILSKTYRETPYVKVEPGMVAGCRHVGKGIIGNEVVIELIHPQQIHPEKEHVETGDYISIEGEPNISLSIKPEIPGGKGTIALATNMIPTVVDWDSGFYSMADLPIPVCLPQKEE